MAATGDLLTSTEVAVLLGVSPSSVKRWAEDGRLACVKTTGKHRRFERAAVERMRGASLWTAGSPAGGAPQAYGGVTFSVDDWVELIRRSEEPQAIAGRLLDARAQLGSWWAVAESLGPVIAEIGRRWRDGGLSMLEEHLCSERLSRALARVSEWIPLPSSAPRALLATAAEDEHTLGLSLVEVCLRERGWLTLWAGRRLPTVELTRRITMLHPPIQLVAVSASASSADGVSLARQARELGDACRARGVQLLLGGAGAWPKAPRYGTRLTSIAALSECALVTSAFSSRRR